MISVIGAGTMGNGIAHVFAQAGYKVTIVDISEKQLEKAMATINKNLDRQLSKGSINEEAKSDTLSNISTATAIKEGIKNADLVVETATENVSPKTDIFQATGMICSSKRNTCQPNVIDLHKRIGACPKTPARGIGCIL